MMAGAALAGAALACPRSPALAVPAVAAAGAAPDDERYWARIAAQYDVTDEVIQLENGNWGMMARPVMEAYFGHVARVNRDSSWYSRRLFGRDALAIRARVAALLAVDEDEIVFTRNATESLTTLIGQYNALQAGEAVLLADLDYDSMQSALIAKAAASGAQVVRIALPEPASREAVLAAYGQAFADHPNLKLALLTHLSHRTGLVLPIAEIDALARRHGIDCIVDAAHSWGQIDFTLPDLGADFVGLNLHKWIGAPLGVGAIYIRRARLAAIDPAPADEARAPERISSRVHTGTTDMAALLAVTEALDFHEAIGGAAKAARLRYLRDRWVGQLGDLPQIEVLTPADPRMYGAITSLRLKDRTSVADNAALARALLERHGIFTVLRTGIASGAAVRVTPALHNNPSQLDALVLALREIARTPPG